jgi:4-hydroxythreonine-4-phosphate dehydrogenase
MKILVTQGDRRGIGPEVLLGALSRFAPGSGTEVLVLADPAALEPAAELLSLALPPEIRPVPDALGALEESVRLLESGDADAVVTAPVHKARLKARGFRHPGQTEFFAERLAEGEHAMMLADGNLRVVPHTTHLPLRDVPDRLDTEGILSRLRLLDRALRRDFGVGTPCIAVLGLNPHAGESGHFGDEEERVIAPAIRRAREEGLGAEGPWPADAAFAPRAREGFDAVLGMYHDQVLGPFKALAAGGGVNVTLGLRAVRTSPDHGTADDIAGRGTADPTSMLRALELAEAIVAARART